MRVEDPEFAEFIRDTAAKFARMIDDNIDRVPFPLDAIAVSIRGYLQFERDYRGWDRDKRGVRTKSRKRENKRPAEARLSLVK